MYGRPLPLTYPQSQIKLMLCFSLDARLIHKILNKYANKVLPKPDPKEIQNSLQVNCRELVYSKDWQANNSGELIPRWKGPYIVILSTPLR